MKVLIIEDDANVVEAVSLCLQLRWPEVTISSAADGTEGIEILESGSFDIVITCDTLEHVAREERAEFVLDTLALASGYGVMAAPLSRGGRDLSERIVHRHLTGRGWGVSRRALVVPLEAANNLLGIRQEAVSCAFGR